jgi:hypothetical protein
MIAKVNGGTHPQQFAQAYLIVFVSKDGETDWHPLRWDEVPEWVKHPDNMARLVDGDMCQDPTQGEAGSSWYKAERVEEPKIKVVH